MLFWEFLCFTLLQKMYLLHVTQKFIGMFKILQKILLGCLKQIKLLWHAICPKLLQDIRERLNAVDLVEQQIKRQLGPVLVPLILHTG